MLRTYTKALRVFREARAPLQAGLLPSDPAFAAARETVSQATQALTLARREYWRHVRSHSCGRAAKGSRKQAIEDRLRQEMLMARELFDGASEKHDYLISLSADAAGTPDGGMAFEQAERVRVRAYEVYFEALRRYADYTMFGDLSEDSATESAAQAKPN